MNNTIRLIIILFAIYIFYKNNFLGKKIENFSSSENKLIEDIKTIYLKDIKKIRQLTLFAEKATTGYTLENVETSNIEVKKSINILPMGIIMAFNGPTQTNPIPEGWNLCDGSKPGIPDLRGRFILASGDFSTGNPDSLKNRNFRESGGQETVTLTNDNLPNHTHSISRRNAHTHSNQLRHLCYWSSSAVTRKGTGITGEHHVLPHSGNHTHTMGTTGLGQSHENMPPYYVLSWIIKMN